MDRKLVRALCGCLVFILLWAGLSRTGAALLPSPLAVAEAFAGLAVQGQLARDVSASLYRVIAGVGMAFGLVLALTAVAMLSPAVSDFVSGPLELVRPVPPIAWIPLAIMLLGIGNASAIAIVALGAFFPMWLSALRGIAGVRRAHIMAARSLGARSRELLSDVIVPSWLPYGLHGLRLGVGMGWFSVVAAEMMGATMGLGQGVQLFSLNLQIAQLYAYIVTIGVLGFSLNHLLMTVERRSGRWQSLESWRND
jgi:ABC-type nitrate/sulfonate/bicarbonate transport system permease component